jgi:branched-chain amino acid transport system permease protein
MTYLVQQLVNGVTLGLIYGLIALGYTMVYGIIGMINFAHGDVFMIGAFVALIFLASLSTFGLSLPIALALAMTFAVAITSLYGWAIERVAYRPLRGSFRLAPLISAIGMSIALQNFVQISQGAQPKALPTMLAGGITLLSHDGFDVELSWIKIAIIVVTLAVLAGFTWLVTRTSLGRAMRACEQDPKMASLLGVDTDRTISLTFILGAGLAAVAGLMFLLYYGVADFFMGFIAGIKAFTAAVLGGIGSLPGAVLGGLLIGLIETLWSAYFSVAYKDVAAFSILVLLLIIKPSGLLGRTDAEKV